MRLGDRIWRRSGESEDLKLTYPFSWPIASLSGLAGDSGECLLEVGAGKTELVGRSLEENIHIIYCVGKLRSTHHPKSGAPPSHSLPLVTQHQ